MFKFNTIGEQENLNILRSDVFIVNFEHVLACWAI